MPLLISDSQEFRLSRLLPPAIGSKKGRVIQTLDFGEIKGDTAIIELLGAGFPLLSSPKGTHYGGRFEKRAWGISLKG